MISNISHTIKQISQSQHSSKVLFFLFFETSKSQLGKEGNHSNEICYYYCESFPNFASVQAPMLPKDDLYSQSTNFNTKT